jgi:molecular chaperone HtpG
MTLNSSVARRGLAPTFVQSTFEEKMAVSDKQTLGFQAEVKQLLHLMIHSRY